MSLFVEKSWMITIILTCLIAGGSAFMMGRSLAIGWRPIWQLLLGTITMGLGLRFLHFALFEGELLSVYYFSTDTLILMIMSALGYQMTRTSQMVNNYPWAYKRTSILSWAEK